MLVAFASNFLSALWQRTLGHSLPLNVDILSDHQTIMSESQVYSCPSWPPQSTTERTKFGTQGCIVFGYPPTGGVLVKHADLLDMLFLSLPCTHVSQRSPSADEEDEFCRLVRRTGATLWPDKEVRIEALLGLRELTEEQAKVLVFGWPTDGVGVWKLRFGNEEQLPRDFGRMRFAMNMEERIQIMKEYGAAFVEVSRRWKNFAIAEHSNDIWISWKRHGQASTYLGTETRIAIVAHEGADKNENVTEPSGDIAKRMMFKEVRPWMRPFIPMCIVYYCMLATGLALLL